MHYFFSPRYNVILIPIIFSDQLNEIRKTSLARLICDNTENIGEVQPLVLEMPDGKRNPKLSCDSGLLFLGIPNVDLSQWRT